VIVLLTAAVWFVYSPMSTHDFLNYDDPLYVTENDVVRDGISAKGLRWALTAHTIEGNWLPLTWLSHMLDVSLYGLQPGGHHLTSLLLHLANCLLVFFVFRQMTGNTWRSGILAALFALHPLHVEPVAWIAQRKELLSSFFGLLATGAYLRYVKNPRPGLYAILLLLFSMSLMSKPMWMTFPALLLLLDVWPLKRFSPAGGVDIPAMRSLVVEKLPLFGLSFLSGLVALFTQQQGGALQSMEAYSLSARLGNALVSYVGYLMKMLWPARLAVFYPHPGDGLPLWKPAAAAALLVVVSFAVLRLFSRRPYLAVGWFWYLISLLPVIGLVQIGGQAMAGRYTYLPLTGVFLAAVWGAFDAVRPVRFGTALLRTGSVLLIIVLAFASRSQLAYWKDSISIFERSLAVTGPNPVDLINLGDAYGKKGRLEEATELYRQALKISPGNPEALYNLGVNLWKSGELEEAKRFYRKTLSVKPNHTDAANNLAVILVRQKRYEEALSNYKALLEAGGGTAYVRGNIGNLMAIMGRKDEAFRYFQEALAMAPEDALIHSNYGVVLENSGRIQEAIAQYSAAIRLDPEMVAPYCRVAALFEGRGDPKKARVFVEMARQRDPAACSGAR
jgi:tetratricopeptide (TPR) repeat protein